MKSLTIFLLLIIASCKAESNLGSSVTDSTKSEEAKVYYHNNGKISVKIYPWENHTRLIQFFNRKGNKTYSMEEVHASYSVRVELKFSESGSVSKAISYTNPGASRYTTETETTFDSDNTPQWMTQKSVPAKQDELINGYPTFYWDTNAKKWVKQEAVKEQAVPRK